MNIHIDVESARKTMELFRKEVTSKELARGTSKAINHSLRELQAQAKLHIADAYNIPAKYLKSIKVKQSSRTTLQGHIYSNGTPLPLRLFNPKYVAGSEEGVSFEVIKGKRSKIGYAFMLRGLPHVYGRGYYLANTPYGFIRKKGKTKSIGKDNGDVRKNREKRQQQYESNSISRLITVSVSGALRNSLHESTVKMYVETVFPDVLITELKARLAKLQAKAKRL